MNSPQRDKNDMVIVYIHKHLQEICDNPERKMILQGLGDQGVGILDSSIISFSPQKKSRPSTNFNSTHIQAK